MWCILFYVIPTSPAMLSTQMSLHHSVTIECNAKLCQDILRNFDEEQKTFLFRATFNTLKISLK